MMARTRSTPWRGFLSAAILAAVGTVVSAAVEPAARTAAPEAVFSTPPVQVRIWRDKESQVVTLVGRTEDAVMVAGSAAGVPSGKLELSKIARAEFEFDFDRADVAKAVRANDWPGAVRVLTPVLKPALPYLALSENNAIDLVMELGTYMMRAANRTARAALDDPSKTALSQKQYEAAYEIFKECSRATWSSNSQRGILKGCRCLLALNKVKTAQFHVNQMAEPMPGDVAYGHYWLIRAELETRAGNYRDALDSVLKSVCFESKDVETFPDALLLSARCYEEMLEPYRARDVYYEVAKLFPRTDWATVAVERLKAILSKGLTKEKEKSAIENVFFKTGDDINKLAEQLFKDLEKPLVVDEEDAETPSSKPSASAKASPPEESPSAPPPVPVAPPATPPPAAPAVAPAATPSTTAPAKTGAARAGGTSKSGGRTGAGKN
jgi:tetratricopeptide (TPR) repeat protein